MQSNYNSVLVVLSYLVAVTASHVTLAMAGRLRDSIGRAQLVWLFAGAGSMGVGIWSMHFIGMLAFELPILVTYDLPLTALSLLIAVLVSGFALQVVRRGFGGWGGLVVTGILMGAGISAMHYTGMAAMQMSPPIRYDHTLLALSVVIAIAASIAALWIAFNVHRTRPALLGWSRLAAALVMGAAIVGMHYTGMAAANFEAGAYCVSGGPRFDVSSMAYTLAAFSILLLTATLIVSSYDARLSSAQAVAAEQLRIANAQLERRVAERTLNLAREEARKTAILTAALDCIITADSNGVVTEFNPAAERTFGYRRDEAMGRPIAELIVSPEHRAAHFQGLRGFVETGASRLLGKRIEVTTRRKDGECFPAELAISDVRVGDERFFTAFLRDITQRVDAERELRAAKEAAEVGSRAKSAFLAVMSHEIRTPMNAVIGLAELLSLSPLDAEQRDTVDTIRDSSKALLRLIDDVLDFSKIEAGKLDLHEEAASLAQMFEAAHQTFSGVASQKSILLVHRMDPRISPAVFVDRLRLRQVVYNFLSNAIKFTDRGQVELGADLVERQEDHDVLRISVRDTGVGMDARALERLFRPFSQADAAIERRYGGSGLGLAICKRLAELMGGTIEVSSAPAVGTSITLNLSVRRASHTQLLAAQPRPIEAITQAIEGRHAPTIEDARAKGRLVLVVDDHPTNRRMLARQLNTLGYAAQTAADGHEALEHWRAGGLGLVITDCQMPGMDGYQLAGAIRETETSAKRLPIVACTANVSQEAFDQCHSIGMDDVLTKPIELATLKRMLDRWLPAPGKNEIGPPAAIHASFAAIAELAQGDAALERELLEDFRLANTDDLDAAARAVQAGSIDDIHRAAHRIKGAARVIGATGLSQAATTLEQAARSGDLQSVSAAWPALRQECERLDERITEHSRQHESLS